MTAIVAAVLVLANPSAAQQVPTRSLGPPTGRLSTEFSSITSVRELLDGRVLVSDPLDKRIVVGDFRANVVEQVGRIGQGPREYAIALPITAIGGDSSLMIDPFGRRWQLFDGASLVKTLPPDHPTVFATGRAGKIMVDRSGQVMMVRNGPVAADSQSIELGNRETGRLQLIGRLAPPVPGSKGMPPPWSAVWDVATLAPDGWVAVLRIKPAYRVDWRTPAGSWIRGAVIPEPVARVSSGEKDFYMERLAIANGSKRQVASSVADWPDVIPPVNLYRSIRFGPAGELLLPRTRTKAHPEVAYDVIDHQGRRQWRLTLHLGEELLGTGRSSAYVVFTTADGLQRLQRYDWPK